MPKPFEIRHDSQVIKERSSRRYSGRSISSQGEDSKPQGFLYQILSLARLLILLPWLAVAYAYPYAQVIYLRWSPGHVAWPAAGLTLVTLAAGLSLVSLLAMGRLFGVRPALRGLVTGGPYRFLRHPMYLSYIVADIGYNLQEWNFVTLLLVLVGWASLVYRIHAEERLLSQHAEWPAYAALVRYRLLPGLW